MKKFASIVALAAVALSPVAALAGGVSVSEGKMIYAADGKRLAPVYHVKTDGSVQVILDGTLATIPAAALSEANGKVVSSVSKADLQKTK